LELNTETTVAAGHRLHTERAEQQVEAGPVFTASGAALQNVQKPNMCHIRWVLLCKMIVWRKTEFNCSLFNQLQRVCKIGMSDIYDLLFLDYVWSRMAAKIMSIKNK